MVVADKVVVELQAKLNRYNADVMNAQRRFETSMDRIARSSLRAESIVLRSSTAIKGALGGITGFLGIREISAYADEWTRAGNLIDARGADSKAVARLAEELDKQRREFSANVLTTMRQAKATRQWRGG